MLDVLQVRSDVLEGAEMSGDESARTRRLELLGKRADILQNQLRKVDLAQTLYEELIEEEPASVSALQALSQIYERKRSWDAWVDVRLKLADTFDLPEESAESLRGDAQIAEK